MHNTCNEILVSEMQIFLQEQNQWFYPRLSYLTGYHCEKKNVLQRTQMNDDIQCVWTAQLQLHCLTSLHLQHVNEQELYIYLIKIHIVHLWLFFTGLTWKIWVWAGFFVSPAFLLTYQTPSLKIHFVIHHLNYKYIVEIFFPQFIKYMSKGWS